jgi:ubiquinone/menaquinone biosynthesis C-methylase UbiE
MKELCFRFNDFLQKIITPTLQYSQNIYEQLLFKTVTKESIWMDVGCGHQLLPDWRLESEKKLAAIPAQLVGFDYDLPSVQNHPHISLKVQGDASYMPFKDQCFSLVTANMVVEHFDNPDLQFKEIHRVLKQGGQFIFHTPNTTGYTTILSRMVPEFVKPLLIKYLQGREEHDVFDTHYLANSPEAVGKIADQYGFSVKKISFIASSAQFIMLPFLLPFELLFIRLSLTKPFRFLRPNILVTLIRE